MPTTLEPIEYIDGIGVMDRGMNEGQSPTILKANQLARATNVTVRGDYVNNRPTFRKLTLNFNDPSVQALLSAYYQGGCFYQPDFGNASLMAAIAGRLLQFQIAGNVATVTDQSIAGDYNTSQPTQSWLWQSENYVIVNDGQHLPIFFDGNSSRRSLGPPVSYGNVTANFTIPKQGSPVNITLPTPFPGLVGSSILIDDELYRAEASSAYTVILTNRSDTSGNTVSTSSQILSEPSVWGVLNQSTTVGPGNYTQGAVMGTLHLTLPTAKAGDVIFVTFAPYAQLKIKVKSVSGNAATVTNDSGSTVGVFSGSSITVASGTTIYFAANNQPNVTVNTVQAPFTVPAVNANVTVSVDAPYQGASGAAVYIGTGQYTIVPGPTPPVSTTLTVINIGDDPGTGSNTRGPTGTVGPGTVTSVPELPAGRMGVYGMSRNWMCLTDGRSFIASDIDGGPSGTPINQFRDAVLKITENTFLFEGGVFVVPGAGAAINAMCFAATLDASLGQGPLQVFTANTVFSCNAPVDRSTWEKITNPILTESLITNGALAQNSTTLANGDILFRSIDGIRSLILARRDFLSWGNVPQSREVQPTLNADDASLLNWSHSATFGNRYLESAQPTASNVGVYHPLTIALNFDPLSNLTTKQPSVYDGFWTGINVLQYLTGQFNGVQRCFAFCANTTANAVELWEVLPDDAATEDNGTTPIVMDFTTADLLRKLGNKTEKDYCRLKDGELSVDEVVGPVTFQVFYKPDQYGKWVQWFAWEVDGASTFYPRMGLGEPSGTVYDTTLNRPLRAGYSFQFRLVITGSCRLLAARFKAVPEVEPDFAPQLFNNQIPFTAS